MEWILGLVGLIISALVTALILNAKHAQKLEKITLEFTQVKNEKAELDKEKASLTSTKTSLENSVSELKDKEVALNEKVDALQKTIATLGADKSSLETAVRNANQQLKEQKESFEKEWSEKFETLSSRTLNRVTETLEEKAKKEYQERQELLNKDITTLLEPITKLVKENEEKVKELGDQTIKETTSLKEQLKQSLSVTEKLIVTEQQLANALTDSKGKGNWGELRLQRLLEKSGLGEKVDFVIHPIIKNEESDKLIPDVKITLPNNRCVYIDAKTLLEPLKKLTEDLDSTKTQEERKKLTLALKKEIFSLNDKAYHLVDRESVDFIVLYVPLESLLRVPLEEEPDLIEEAFSKGVILASPLILMTLLKTIEKNWQQAELAEGALKIQDMTREFHERAAIFMEHFCKIQDGITQTQTAYEKAISSFKSRFMPKILEIEKFRLGSKKAIPSQFKLLESLETSEGITTIDVTPRSDNEESITLEVEAEI